MIKYIVKYTAKYSNRVHSKYNNKYTIKYSKKVHYQVHTDHTLHAENKLRENGETLYMYKYINIVEGDLNINSSCSMYIHGYN